MTNFPFIFVLFFVARVSAISVPSTYRIISVFQEILLYVELCRNFFSTQLSSQITILATRTRYYQSLFAAVWAQKYEDLNFGAKFPIGGGSFPIQQWDKIGESN